MALLAYLIGLGEPRAQLVVDLVGGVEPEGCTTLRRE
jgi:hypothetical protein